MSGQGSGAPTRLTPISIDQPIVDPTTGRPTPFFGQTIQRILSYLGQPGSGSSGGTGGGSSSGSTLTVSQQLTNLTNEVTILQAAAGGTSPTQSGLVSRVTALESQLRSILRLPAPPRPPSDLTGAQILSWWRGG